MPAALVMPAALGPGRTFARVAATTRLTAPAWLPGIAAVAGVRLAVLWLAVLCLAVMAAAVPAAAQQPRPGAVEVLSVGFTGADRIPAELLRTAIVTTPTRCISVALQPLCWMGASKDRYYLDTRALAADVFRLRVFYYQRGFREARVELDTVRAGAGMRVAFQVDEGRPVLVRSVVVESPDGIEPGLERNLPVRAGRPFSMLEFEAARDTLRHRLANRGYATADVLANYEITADDPYYAEAAFHLIPGPLARFGSIEITGTERVSPAIVRRMLSFREGDLYSRQALLRSQRNLFGLEVFRHAEITTPPAVEGDTVVDVRVQVNEGDLHRVRLGIGMSTTDYLNAEGRWVSRNFLGGARRLEVRGRITNIVAPSLSHVPWFERCTGIYCDIAGSLVVDVSQPWFLGSQNTLGTGVFAERFSLPGVYVRTSQGAHASLRRSVLRTGTVAGAYRPELTRLESDGDLIFCVNFVTCEEAEIDVLRQPHWLSPVAASFALDRSNSPFSPTRGYIIRVDSEFAATYTGSDFDYLRALGEVSAYHDPFRGVVIATRLRSGWARAVSEPGAGLGVHPQKRFFAGGPNSVRGFAQYRLGPKLLTVDAKRVLAQPSALGGAGCTAQDINAGACDVTQLADERPGALYVQPVGGAVALEGNIEVRYPIWADHLRGATFLDFGQVWRSHGEVELSRVQFTPGLGIRYFSPIGPIRVDVGYNPARAERLDVVTTEVCDVRVTPCGEIMPGVVYAPGDLENLRKLRAQPAVMWQPLDSFMDRLQFHFSIGQAF
jgi:outer membrane protein assembly factor BamA